ncbi:serine hydrolase [Micromonospora sp. NBC_01813]|uniref:serine hydrolase n=1 Tax=Micromonospora sp. NBC_01813 TaxID=2975988 RepID=UPI002DD98243|nr:serine hydrolase [Micromonospora sp. NBC_01813]WSA06560.1 class A beta-lactamase-related serine hydrolase [Micromonospora sp. NBC_01813]
MKSGRHRAAGGRATRRPDHSAPRHQQRRAGQRRPLIAALGLLIVLSAFVSWLPGDVGQPPPRQPGWTISDSDQRTVLLRDAVVPVPTDGFFSWAAMNRRTGLLTGSANLNAQSDTMSLVKAWLAADDLRRADERGRLPRSPQLAELSAVIRDSDNAGADATYDRVGGRESLERMVRVCGLTDTAPVDHRWSNTLTSARDLTRLGRCLADGRAAGEQWTPWLLAEMRAVRGEGDFGPRDTLTPEYAATIAIKNGWLLRDEDQLWHVSCLAIGEHWVIGALARYPGEHGLDHGVDFCRQVGAALLLVA